MTKYRSGLPPTPSERTEKLAETVGGWLVLILVGVGVLLWWDGKFSSLSGLLSSYDLSNSHALEVRCVTDTGLDYNKLCLEPERIGAELEFRVNTTTEKVQITVVKNDGNYFYKDKLLEHCSVVDTSNWKCTEGPIELREVHGMSHGRYYRSLTGDPPGAKFQSGDYYTSSITGDIFWALHNHSISVQTAMERTGYSRKSLATFVDPELQRLQQEEARDAQAQSELDRRNHCEAERALGRKCEEAGGQ